MPISPGARLGSYEVLSPLGAGGMGTQMPLRFEFNTTWHRHIDRPNSILGVDIPDDKLGDTT